MRMFLVASFRASPPSALGLLGTSMWSKRVRRIKQAARALGLACIRRAKHKLDIAFPVESDGHLQIQPCQWKQLVLPVRSQKVELARFEPVVPGEIAAAPLKNEQCELLHGRTVGEINANELCLLFRGRSSRHRACHRSRWGPTKPRRGRVCAAWSQLRICRHRR